MQERRGRNRRGVDCNPAFGPPQYRRRDAAAETPEYDRTALVQRVPQSGIGRLGHHCLDPQVLRGGHDGDGCSEGEAKYAFGQRLRIRARDEVVKGALKVGDLFVSETAQMAFTAPQGAKIE